MIRSDSARRLKHAAIRGSASEKHTAAYDQELSTLSPEPLKDKHLIQMTAVARGKASNKDRTPFPA